MPRQPKPEKTSDSSTSNSKPRDPAAQVLAWVLAGNSERDIIDAVATTYPGADPLALMAQIVGGLERAASASPELLMGWCFEATRELYRRMVEIGDFPGALRAVKQIAELAKNVYDSEEEEEPDEGEGVRSPEAKGNEAEPRADAARAGDR